MIDFFGPGYDAVKAMGLLPAIEEVAYRIEEASFLDEAGRRRAGVNPTQFTQSPLLNLMRPDLEHVLREHVPPEVNLRFGTSPTAVTDHGEGVRVTLTDGSHLDADLLVGADGIHSTVRRLVFGEESRFIRYLGFHTAAFSFDSPQLHAAIKGRVCLTDTVGRQMGFYALRDGRVVAFAVHRTPNHALPADVQSAVRNSYAGMGWVVPEALDRCPPSAEIFYDHVAQIHMPSWAKGRVVLVGDAGYAVSLLAGLGASLGIAGAWVLADQLAQPQSIDQALVQYERHWRPVVEDKQRSGRAAARWFLPATDLHLWMRRSVLRMARLPIIERYVAASLEGKPTALITNLHQGTRALHLPGTEPSCDRQGSGHGSRNAVHQDT